MNKTFKKILVASAATTMLTTSAFSHLKISGYGEAGLITGSMKGTLSDVSSKGIGQEFVLLAENTGKTAIGDYRVFLNIDTDEARNGMNLVSPHGNAFGARGIELMPTKETMLFYTYEGVYGGEIARTTIPVVTERVGDLFGTGAEFIDVTSGSHAYGIEFRPTGHRVSLAYSPTLNNGTSSSSDRLNGAASTIATGGDANHASGHSVGYRGTFGAITVGAGYTSIDQKKSVQQDVNSKTAGLIFTQAPFAVGIQRTVNEGTKAPVTSATQGVKRVIDNVGVSFAATKEVTVGATYSKIDETHATLASGPDTKILQGVVAYNLGPVVLSLAHEAAKNKTGGNVGPTATVSGLDHNLTKVKVKANF